MTESKQRSRERDVQLVFAFVTPVIFSIFAGTGVDPVATKPANLFAILWAISLPVCALWSAIIVALNSSQASGWNFSTFIRVFVFFWLSLIAMAICSVFGCMFGTFGIAAKFR